MKPETQEWLTRATEDLEALSELNPDRTPSVIASLAHQAIEKTIKAVWIELNLEPPMIHDLEMLWSEIEQNVSKSPDTDDFAEILFEINTAFKPVTQNCQCQRVSLEMRQGWR